MTIEEKAQKWDELVAAVEKFYFDEDGNERPEGDPEAGDLISIGEVAAIKLGFM